MAKKLMAILGASAYKEATYEFNIPGKHTELYTGFYSTAAVAKALFRDLNESDDCYVVVFLTKEARENNWENRVFNTKDKKDKEKGKGLKFELSNAVPQLRQSDRIRTREIEDGKNVHELWSIVKTVLGEIEDGDEIYLDITTGFRSIPLLSLLVINYARIVKGNVMIKGIYYGAIEAIDKATGRTPIFDLWPMIEVTDWSYAIHSFFKHGSASEISDLLDNTKGNVSDGEINNLVRLGHLLKKFSDNIHMTRGYDLIYEYNYDDLKRCVDTIRQEDQADRLSVAKGLIERVDKIIDLYDNNNVANGFAAVKWCIDHNLIHQGFILLQETVVTCLIMMAGLNERRYVNHYGLRILLKKILEKKDRNNRLLTFKDINDLATSNEIKEGNIIRYLYNIWVNVNNGSRSYNSSIELIAVQYSNSTINDHFVDVFIRDSNKRCQEDLKPFLEFIGKCLKGFSRINEMDIKYSYFMHELSIGRNNLAHGGFSDGEVTKIIEFRRKWNPNSSLVKRDISSITFIDVLNDIYDNMEGVFRYAKRKGIH